jgi:hypothetical protein
MEIDVRHMKEAPLTSLKHTFGRVNIQAKVYYPNSSWGSFS